MKKHLLKYAYWIAGLLVVAGLAFLFLGKPEAPETLQSEFFQPEEDKLGAILRKIKVFGFTGVPQTQDDSLAVALDLYGAANYKAAQQSLEEYLAAYANDHTARFYLGMTHLRLKSPEQAFSILSPLSELKNFEMQDDARWYAALAAIEVDEIRATGLFAQLSKDPTSKYQQAAQIVVKSMLKRPGKMSIQVENSTVAGEALRFSLVIAGATAWWQAGWFRALIAFLFPASGMGMVVWRNKFKHLEKEKRRSDELLLNILPAETTAELKKYGHSDVRRYEDVTVLFCDFQEFTKISELLTPEELVGSLGECFEAFDRIITRRNLEKIKTVGDCYICAGGLAPPTAATGPQEKQAAAEAVKVARTARAMQKFLKKFNARQAASGRPVFEARIGIHTGPVVAGIVGIKKYAYDIWGDTVNIAARMEQNSLGGRINISETTYALLKNNFLCQYRGKIGAKGKGELDMYFLGKPQKW